MRFIAVKMAYFLCGLTFAWISCNSSDTCGQESFYEKYKYSTDTSISLIAAWRLATPLDEDDAETDLREVVRFVGFVEGTLGLDAPAEWRETLLSRQFPFVKASIFTPPIELPKGLSPDVLPYVSGYDDLDVKSHIVFQLDNGQFNTRVRKRDLPYRQPYVFKVNENLFAVGFYEFLGPDSFLMTLIDDTGAKQWSTEVLAIGIPIDIRGSLESWHQVSFVQTEDKIIVFGIGHTCLYIEAFDKVTGKRAFRFTSLLDLEKDEETGVVQAVRRK